jgi:hypothetical protein
MMQHKTVTRDEFEAFVTSRALEEAYGEADHGRGRIQRIVTYADKTRSGGHHIMAWKNMYADGRVYNYIIQEDV